MARPRRVKKRAFYSRIKPQLLSLVFCGVVAGLGLWQAYEANLDSKHLALALSEIPVLTRHPPSQRSPAPRLWLGPVEPMALPPGPAPTINRIITSQPVVFVGIDDGWIQTPENLAWLSEHRLPFTMFLTDNGIKNNYAYFRQLQSAGLIVENHTISHPNLTRLNLDHQKAEICTAADTYQSVYGRRPTLFRPPYGALNPTVHQAAADCGMRAIIMWHAKVDNGVVQYQDNNQHLLPGDIVLMHFKPDFLHDMQAFTEEVNDQHLFVSRLEDWLE